MTGILRFLADFCAFLWTGGHYRIVDSAVAESNGGDAWVLVASDRLRLRFISDRRQLLLDFQGTAADQQTSPAGNQAWYSIDIVWRLLGGETRDSALLDERYADFLRENLEQIENLFANSEEWPETLKNIRRLQRLRSKELFG